MTSVSPDAADVLGRKNILVDTQIAQASLIGGGMQLIWKNVAIAII